MSIALDGFEILKRLGNAPDAFAPVRSDVDKAARTLVVKCIKGKGASIQSMRAIQSALHLDQFELVVDGLKDAELKTLLGKLDKHHPDLKTMSSQRRRHHLLALAGGRANPVPAAAKAAAKKSQPKAKKSKSKLSEPERLQSDVMDLFRARGRESKD